VSPVRAADRGRYPAGWPQIPAAIRFGRGRWPVRVRGRMRPGTRGAAKPRRRQAHPVTGSLVALTCAHRDHVPGHRDPANLFAACQRRHLAPTTAATTP
jgi:hypothetical protein